MADQSLEARDALSDLLLCIRLTLRGRVGCWFATPHGRLSRNAGGPGAGENPGNAGYGDAAVPSTEFPGSADPACNIRQPIPPAPEQCAGFFSRRGRAVAKTGYIVGCRGTCGRGIRVWQAWRWPAHHGT